jgi:hypothetical protein
MKKSLIRSGAVPKLAKWPRQKAHTPIEMAKSLGNVPDVRAALGATLAWQHRMSVDISAQLDNGAFLFRHSL